MQVSRIESQVGQSIATTQEVRESLLAHFSHRAKRAPSQGVQSDVAMSLIIPFQDSEAAGTHEKIDRA